MQEELTYPQNIIIDVIGSTENVNLEKFDESFAYVTSSGFKPRELEVIYYRYVEELTLAEIGAKYGLTRERVRQIQNRAIKRLKEKSRIKYLKYGIEGVQNGEAEKDKVAVDYDSDIRVLDLSFRSEHYLRENGINNVKQLLKLSNDDIKKIRHLGVTSYNEIVNKLDENGYSKCTRDIKIELNEIMLRYSLTKEQLIKQIEEL